MNTTSDSFAPAATDRGIATRVNGCADFSGAAPGKNRVADQSSVNDHRGNEPRAGDHRTDHHDGDIRPLITRHRLRRRRRRTAATLLAGASIALGAAAMRSPGASAHAPAATPVTDASPHPAASEQPPPASIASSAAPAIVPTAEPSIGSSSEPKTETSTLEAPSAGDQADDDVQISG
ncbi:MAG TPA: hypothetical protein VGZ32_19065 [Actinocrinis sp.]|jgi:hypothetical protein|uniref:hypothetical protein n=1 Tax=Actinocrinis sp. TaxID=1920516 RepID=UPI002DDD40CF|nr:hypothetical protein [Actinocrinis sp.]HEV3172455.1 hypothetical protein [Actinocrinis sp.]